MFVFGLFTFAIFTGILAKYNIFENQTIELTFNELAFFESPDFPVLHDASEIYGQNTTFLTKNSSINGIRCIAIIRGLSYKPTPYKNIFDIFVFYSSTFFLQTYHYLPQNYQALSGYIYFEQNDNSCPFEHFSRKTPFKFVDETQIVHIASVYVNKTNFGDVNIAPQRQNDCKWLFIAPDGYGLKMVIQNFQVSAKTVFEIYNSTDLLLNEHSAKINHPFYFFDQYRQFDITLSKDNKSMNNEVEFSAYVTIVKQKVSMVDGNCFAVYGESNFTWQSANLTKGYSNNIYCNFEVLVQNDTNILAFVEQLSVEEHADYLSYHDFEYSYLLKLHDQMLLTPFINGSAKTYYFKFVSDGSVVESGFKINFAENLCHCGAPNISCNNQTNTVANNTNFVCPFMTCTFDILPCATNYSNLLLSLTNYTEIDNVKVLSNNIIVYDSSSISLNSSGDQNIYLFSENNNTLIINSLSRSRKISAFSVSPFELPLVEEHAILRENGTNYVLDASVTTYATIEVEEPLMTQSQSLIVYGRNDLVCKNGFYSNETLNEMVFFDNCKKSAVFYKCDSGMKKMTYFHNGIVLNCFIGFSLSTHMKNCVFNNTVYFVEGEMAVVSAMSTTGGECQITIIKESDKSYLLTNIFTTARNDTVKIFFGENENTLFFEFNKITAKKWRNVLVTSDIYAVKIPKGAVVLLTFVSVKLPLQEHIAAAPFYSMIGSFHYGLKSCFNYGENPYITFTISGVVTKFTILKLQLNEDAYFIKDDVKININQIGDTFVFVNETISLFIASTAQNYCGCIILMEAVELQMINYF